MYRHGERSIPQVPLSDNSDLPAPQLGLADGSLRAFAAWNPPSYTKSWSLYLRQVWARRTRGLVLPWPLSYIVPPPPPKAAATATGQKARFDRIFTLRKDMMSRIPPDPQKIWLMHFAGDDDAVDQLMRERVLRDADEYGSAIHMQTQHTMAGVVKAQETWGFKMVTEDVFVDRETRIPMWLLLRPAKK